MHIYIHPNDFYHYGNTRVNPRYDSAAKRTVCEFGEKYHRVNDRRLAFLPAGLYIGMDLSRIGPTTENGDS